ncbi:MAG: tRNA (guanosine(46)-N7)-methyltransferase TrmB, partial [Gammaproteobacteria bacterium]|nr:tRNA (guanosine(46)-N7)-methyltransferase TrmB [Gammaproteobacteria bacterium]
AGTVHRVSAFFPDPWPKKRHHKRRLVNEDFAAAATACLEVGGTLHLATDWDDYAAQMIDVLDAAPDLAGGVTRRAERPVTPFEAKGIAGGRRVVDLAYRRLAPGGGMP